MLVTSVQGHIAVGQCRVSVGSETGTCVAQCSDPSQSGCFLSLASSSLDGVCSPPSNSQAFMCLAVPQPSSCLLGLPCELDNRAVGVCRASGGTIICVLEPPTHVSKTPPPITTLTTLRTSPKTTAPTAPTAISIDSPPPTTTTSTTVSQLPAAATSLTTASLGSLQTATVHNRTSFSSIDASRTVDEAEFFAIVLGSAFGGIALLLLLCLLVSWFAVKRSRRRNSTSSADDADVMEMPAFVGATTTVVYGNIPRRQGLPVVTPYRANEYSVGDFDARDASIVETHCSQTHYSSAAVLRADYAAQ